MGRIFDSMVKFFEEDNWHFVQEEGESRLLMTVVGSSGDLTCLAEAREEQKTFVFYTIFGVNIPKHRRRDAAEFFTRANSGLVLGNFEMDMDDGEVCYKTSISVEDAPLTSSEIRKLVYLGILMADRYLPGLITLLYSNASPQQALTQVEFGRAWMGGTQARTVD
jgi:hypothetical protein